MAIRIERNEAGNCINFHGASNPTYWNACLSGVVDSVDTSSINVVNDIITAQTGETEYEYFRVPFTQFVDADGNAFVDAQATADYITLNANVSAPTDINIGYKGVFDASTSLDPTDASPVNGDWYYVGTEGTIDTVLYKVNDIIKYSETSTTWERIQNKNATVTELENSALDQYNIHVDADYTGTIRNGSALYPYTDLSNAISSSNDADSILVKGVNIITAEIVLPHSLSFYGANEAEIKYVNFNASNGDILSFTGTDTETFIFKDITFRNAGGYGLYIKKTDVVEIRNCKFFNNGWNGLALNTVVPSATLGLLGYDSSQSDLQAFYASANASNGGAIRIQECKKPLLRESRAENNLRGFRLQDCGIYGGGFVIENQSLNNIESGIYLAAGSLGGCQNITVTVNYSSYNANNGLLSIGGINNKFSQNEVNGNWNAGLCAWGSTNLTLRDSGLYDNNRSQYNGIGNSGDAKASIQINDAYSFIATQITYNPSTRFIAEILDTQVHYTGLGSNTQKIGFLLTSGMGSIPDNDKNIIKVDDVGFIGQDYAIDLSEVDVSNLRLSLGDNSYQSVALGAVKAPLQGNYSELPFSNHVMSVPSLDIVLDTLKSTIALHEGVNGNVINVYNVNELQSIINGNKVDIIQKNSDKIQLRGLTLGNVYVNGVIAGSNLATMNDTINSAFAMSLVQYKDFLESEVGIDANVDIPSGLSAAFYYIESPVGSFHYPLFKAESDANLVDTTEGGSGTSHTHTYVDDLTSTTWYMPNTNATMSGTTAPLNGLWSNHESVVWNIQTTDDDTNYLPTFTNTTYNVQEGSVMNIQYKPSGDTATYTLSNNPYSDNGYAITGTAEDITNGAGQSVSHTINVLKDNGFGSVSGTITINVLADLASNEFTVIEKETSGVVDAIKFTQDSGDTELDFNTVTFAAGSTYKFFIDHLSVESNDTLMVTLVSDSTAYTTGVTISGTYGTSGSYVQFVVPSDVPPVKLTWTSGTGEVVDTPMTVSGSTWSATVATVINEGPATVSGASLVSADNWYSLGETLSAGERLIIPTSFFQDMWLAMPSYSNLLCIGLKDGAWVNTKDGNNTGSVIPSQGLVYDLMIRMQKKSFGNGGEVRILSNYYTQGAAISWAYPQTPSSANVAGIIEITPNGNNVRMGITTDIAVDVPSTTIYSDWSTNKGQTGNQSFGITEKDVMFFWDRSTSGGQFDHADVDFTVLTEVAIPVEAPSYGSTTSFAKAFNVVGPNAYLYQTDSSNNQTPLAHSQNAAEVGLIPSAGATSSSNNSYPWMMGGVYYLDPANSAQMFSFAQALNTEQRILLGYETSGTATRNPLTFYWGTSNSDSTPLNGIQFDMDMPDAGWYSYYIDQNGVRLNETNVAEAAAMLRFKQVDLLTGAVSTLTGTWTQHGTGRTSYPATSQTRIRMGKPAGTGSAKGDQAFKIANFAVSTLRADYTLPTDAEIELFINDPNKWRIDYRVGTTQRFPHHSTNNGLYQYDSYQGYMSQHWSFGDHQLSTTIGAIHETFPSLENGFRAVGPNVGKASITNGTASDSINVIIAGLS